MSRTYSDPEATLGRISWVDSARGLSVIAIVLFHVVLWDYHDIPGAENPPLSGFWSFQNGLMGSIRIPMLLLLSGMLASKKIRRGFGASGVYVNIFTNAYFYFLWLGIYGAFFLFTTGDLPHRITGVRDFALNLVLPDTTLWYIFALVVFVPVLAVCRQVPAWCVLATLVIVFIAMHAWSESPAMWTRLPGSMIFFALGVYGARWLSQMTQKVRLWHLLVLLMVPPMALFVHGRVNVEVIQGALGLVVQLSFAALALAVVIKMGDLKIIRRLGQTIGRRTLAIYVLHALFLYIWLLFGQSQVGTEFREAVFGSAFWGSLYPMLVTFMILGLSLTVHWLVSGTRFRFLFVAPPVVSRVGRWLETRAVREDRPFRGGSA
ncbi:MULTISPECIES: acyltransferase family protein [Micrococcaceae]|uniref:acyltransferase family protein n=1 Tax=Micrococcaceae TaxID=1268 RepID=UPI000BB80EB9|nr:acyltransferase family protein [Glutamicibacter sp. BW78]PCC25756.1 hypothetical protein CIK75_04535 [Glutamicibacter sp. BW78]